MCGNAASVAVAVGAIAVRASERRSLKNKQRKSGDFPGSTGSTGSK